MMCVGSFVVVVVVVVTLLYVAKVGMLRVVEMIAKR